MLFEKLGWPRSGMPRPLAHRALAPVRGDDVARADRPLRPRLAVPDDRGHAVLVLVERDQLRRVLEPCAELVGMAAEDRLEPDLGDEQPRRRAQRLVALVDVAEVVLELLARPGSRPRRSRRPARTRGRTPRRSPLRARGFGRSRSSRWLNIAARGWIAVPGCRSTVSDGTPFEARRSEVDSPTRLPPTIRTGTSSSCIAVEASSLG